MKKILFVLVLIAGAIFSLFYGSHGGSCQSQQVTIESPSETKMVFPVVENKTTETAMDAIKTEKVKVREEKEGKKETIERIEVARDEVKEKADKNIETISPTIIHMESEIYKKHRKRIVVFNHLKHADYACGECHHDTKGAPLTQEMIQTQGIDKCSKCHNKVGKRPAGLSKKDRLSYHKEALHKSCKGCHRKVRKEGKVAPVTCKGCHTN